MKKVSTVAAKQGRNISQQKLTIGLDLGDRNSYYCVVNEVGELVLARIDSKLLYPVQHRGEQAQATSS